MQIKYVQAPDVKDLVDEIAEHLDFFHIVPQFVHCYRSEGSSSRRVIARIHGLGKIWQEALGLPPSYVIEVISERYDRLTKVDREKTIIHELLHIPHGFAGGFRPHKGYISRETVDKLYRTLVKQREAGNAEQQ